MGPPGGGRNTVTPRFLRHFNVVSMNEFSEDTMTKIFSTLISTYLRVRIVGDIGSQKTQAFSPASMTYLKPPPPSRPVFFTAGFEWQSGSFLC